MKKVIVTGANGQVGAELQHLVANHHSPTQFEYIFTDSSTLDITNLTAVDTFFATHRPFACINCAAYTAVDKAESDVEAARAANVYGVAHLAAACETHGAILLHLSTDYVYHAQNTPLVETDAVAPASVYATTKLEGEQNALERCSRAVVLRTSWVYSSFGNNFVKTMRRLGRDRDALSVVFDQVGSPTYARDLAAALIHIITKIESETNDTATALVGVYGQVFNYSNEGVTSWYDFARTIFELSNIACAVAPIRSADYPTAATRPSYSVLDKAKIKARFGLTIPHFSESLRACIAVLDTP